MSSTLCLCLAIPAGENGDWPRSGIGRAVSNALRAPLDFVSGLPPAQQTSVHAMPVVDPYLTPPPRPGESSHLAVFFACEPGSNPASRLTCELGRGGRSARTFVGQIASAVSHF